MISIITASLPLTAILGAIMLKKIMKKIKARHLMIIMDIISIVGILIQDISLSFLPLLLGRLILGFSVGINSGLVPQYIYSVTPTVLAGSIGSLHQGFLMVGVAIGYSLGYLVDPENIEDGRNWRILISFPMLTCIIRSVVLTFLLPYEIPSHRMREREIQRL